MSNIRNDKIKVNFIKKTFKWVYKTHSNVILKYCEFYNIYKIKHENYKELQRSENITDEMF